MLSDNSMVSAMHSILDISEHRIDPSEFLGPHTGRCATDGYAPVRVGFHDCPETEQPVGDHLGSRRLMQACPATDRVAAKTLQRGHTHRQRSTVGAASHGGAERRLAGRSATALVAPTLAAPVHVAALDQAIQRLAVIALTHGLHQLVLDQPANFVRHTKVAAQCERRRPGLALDQQENRQEPGRQRQFGLLNQGSGGQRRLMVAPVTLKQRAIRQGTVGSVPALRVAEALRPAQLEPRILAGCLGSIFVNEFGQTETLSEIASYSSLSGNILFIRWFQN